MSVVGGPPQVGPSLDEILDAAEARETAKELEQSKSSRDSVQWQILADGNYLPIGETCKAVPPGFYEFRYRNNQLVLGRINLVNDTLLRLSNSPCERVLSAVDEFWESRARFEATGQLFKRGILLWGPAGSGKSSVLALVAEDILKRGGIVLVTTYPSTTVAGLKMLRMVEPDRPLVNIIEDIDELVKNNDPDYLRSLLSLLDGEDKTDNIVHLGTTNHPEDLDQRFIRRPSRFDEIIEVPPLAAASRREYLAAKSVPAEALEQWTLDTDGFTVAHLRELVVAVLCLNRDYAVTLIRLREMLYKSPKGYGVEGPKGIGLGFVEKGGKHEAVQRNG